MSSCTFQQVLLDQLMMSNNASQHELINQAIAHSLDVSVHKPSEDEQLRDLKALKLVHDVDLYKTQNIDQGTFDGKNTILLLVKFPVSGSTVSCGGSQFKTVTLCFSKEAIESTGSQLLLNLLSSEQHQRRAKRAAMPLPEGITHVLDLSPTDEEDDYILALTALSLPKGVKVWHRFAVQGVSILATAGHDDVCSCMLPISGLLEYDHGYPPQKAPEDIMSAGEGNVCIFDTDKWPMDKYGNIAEFCTTRWAANTIRLFRTLAEPAGQKSLLIDSAPRLWTLVGLFIKLEMTNYDILRDDVVAWFNANGNSRFVELCPEETLRIGLAINAPILSEPAFCILVNERALEVAGGQPAREPSRTVFGRRGTSFTGTDTAESTLRMIEHASVKMAERYKAALDRLYSDEALDILLVPEWQVLSALHKRLQTMATVDNALLPVLDACASLMRSIQQMFRSALDTVVNCNGDKLPTTLNPLFLHQDGKFTAARMELTVEHIDDMRAFTVPKVELLAQSFVNIYDSLNRNQRALIPLVWDGLWSMSVHVFPQSRKHLVHIRTIQDEVIKARDDDNLQASDCPEFEDVVFLPNFHQSLQGSIIEKIQTYVDPLLTKSIGFSYSVTPHMVLALDDEEMNFLRRGNEEATFQEEAPETEMGPSGPGPAYHTGRTNASVSDLDFEGLALSDGDDASTVVGSMAAQDGVSTVYNHRRVQARSVEPSVSSEQFTEGSSEYLGAEYALPADHQLRGQTLAQVVQEEKEDAVRSSSEDADDRAAGNFEDIYYQYSEDGSFVSGTDNEDQDENEEDLDEDEAIIDKKHKEDKSKEEQTEISYTGTGQTEASVKTSVARTGGLDDDDVDFEFL